jgi:L-fuconolactonase
VTDPGILDSHHHLWDPQALDYELFRSIQALHQRFAINEYDQDAAPLGIVQSICVEAASAGADGRRETEWLLQQVSASDRVAALVAWAPLERPDLEAHLEWLHSLDGKPIVGIRRSFEFEDDDFPKRSQVIDGARLAGERGLVVDLVLFSRSLAATIRLVEGCPGTTFVLDHLGKPPIREKRTAPWADQIHELGLLPNVACKLSGLTTEAGHTTWTRDDLKPYVEHGLECFGSNRLMYGSDWPVVNLARGHKPWLQTVTDMLSGLGAHERLGILARNARAIYSIPWTGHH